MGRLAVVVLDELGNAVGATLASTNPLTYTLPFVPLTGVIVPDGVAREISFLHLATV